MCSPKPTEIVGYGFRPTDEELVDFYLKHKLLGDDPRVHVLTHIDLCDVEPWEVPGNNRKPNEINTVLFLALIFASTFIVSNSVVSKIRSTIQRPRMVFLQSC